jgi:hypothetical protein
VLIAWVHRADGARISQAILIDLRSEIVPCTR